MARPRGSACITAKGYSRVETRDKSRSTPVTWHGQDRQRLLLRRNENKVHSEIRNVLSLPLKDAHPCPSPQSEESNVFLVLPSVCVPGKRHLGINQPKSLFSRNWNPVTRRPSITEPCVPKLVMCTMASIRKKHDSKRVVALTCWMGPFP